MHYQKAMSLEEEVVLHQIKCVFADPVPVSNGVYKWDLVARLRNEQSVATHFEHLWEFALDCARVVACEDNEIPFPMFRTQQHARLGVEVLFPFMYDLWCQPDEEWTLHNSVTSTFIEFVHNMTYGGFGDYFYYREWLHIFDVLSEMRMDDKQSVALMLCMLNGAMSTHGLFIEQHAVRLFEILKKLLLSGTSQVKYSACAMLLRFELFGHVLFSRGCKQIIIQDLNNMNLHKSTLAAFSKVLAEYASTSLYACFWTQQIAVSIVLRSPRVKRYLHLIEATMRSPQTFSHEQLCCLENVSSKLKHKDARWQDIHARILWQKKKWTRDGLDGIPARNTT